MAKQPPGAGQPSGPRVHIVGGGISGLTAALRLAQRGYCVTVYEERDVLGGNLAGFRKNGCYYDVYPHMYGDFYENFWDLAEGDLGMSRGTDFEPHETFKILDSGKFPRYIDLLNVAAPMSNFFSGCASPGDVLLGVYSLLDIMSYGPSEDGMLDGVGVEGFLRTRPYATKGLAKIHESILMTIWSLHGYSFSSAAYRRFVEHNLPLPSPLLWVLTGDLLTKLMAPLEKKISSYPNAQIRKMTRVMEVVLKVTPAWQETGIISLALVGTKLEGDKWVAVQPTLQETVPIEAGDAVILAVPPRALAYLLSAGVSRVLDKLPQLSHVRELSAAPVPVLYLYFKKKLPNVPKEYVLLRNSPYNLSFLDISQNWHDDPNMKAGTVLCLAASDFYAIPWSTRPGERYGLERDTARFGFVEQLYQYLPVFNPGRRWNDPESDIDWQKTNFESNYDRMLFCNVVGGIQWQPVTHYDQISNLFFAGDLTVNPVRIATVESAMVSGLNAARGVWDAHPLGTPIPLKSYQPPPPVLFAEMKAMLAPWAYAARYWSNAANALPKLVNCDLSAMEVSNLASDLCATPYLMAADAWQSMIRGTADYWTKAMNSLLSWYKQ
jgi:hypothetical protein